MVTIWSIRSSEEFIRQFWKNGQQPASMWAGREAQLLQCAGKVNQEHLRNLLNGLSPDGRPALVRNAGALERQRGLEFVFDAPKSLSVLWAVAPERWAGKIQGCHRGSAEFAFL